MISFCRLLCFVFFFIEGDYLEKIFLGLGFVDIVGEFGEFFSLLNGFGIGVVVEYDFEKGGVLFVYFN